MEKITMSANIPESKNTEEYVDSTETAGNTPSQHSEDSIQSIPEACETAQPHPATKLYDTDLSPEQHGKPSKSGELDPALLNDEQLKQLRSAPLQAEPVDSLTVELELPSKKLSITLTGTHYLDYKNMLDTLLFPKGTTAGMKDEIILSAAIEHIVALAKKASQNSVTEKGTPFISAGALLAKLWEG